MYNKYMLTILLVALLHFFSSAQISKFEIVATGLTCSMCSNAINKQLKSLSEVDSVGIDLNSNTFTVYIKKESSITPRILKEKVEKAGFFVGSMIASVEFEGAEIADDMHIKKDGLDLIFLDTKASTLTGSVRLKILDKGFVTQKEFKKLSKSMSKYPSFKLENEDDYHVKVIL